MQRLPNLFEQEYFPRTINISQDNGVAWEMLFQKFATVLKLENSDVFFELSQKQLERRPKYEPE